MTGYPCDVCGYDGPHTVTDNDGVTVTVECGSCYSEFTAPSGVLLTTVTNVELPSS